MKKSRVDSKMRSKGARNKDYRFFVIAAVFLVVFCAFTVCFVVNQVNGTSGRYNTDGLTVREETVAGERGRIYDRNGKLLVGNASYYDLIFEYGSMPESRSAVNSSLINCLEALSKTENTHKRAEDYFPFVGSYPELEFSPELEDEDSEVYKHYQRFLSRHELDTDTDEGEIAQYFIKQYGLDASKYSYDAIEQLMRIYYDMERINFGYYQYYTIAQGFEATVPEDMALISYIEEHRIEGATLIRSSDRVYCYGDYAKHILGSVGGITAENVDSYADYPLDAKVGISGCENVFESFLRGSDGKRISKYNAEGDRKSVV